jgi:hypothetical protein
MVLADELVEVARQDAVVSVAGNAFKASYTSS